MKRRNFVFPETGKEILLLYQKLFHMLWFTFQFSSVTQSCATLCDWMVAARQASLSITTPGAYSNSRPSSQWCHPIISSSVVTFSFCLQSFPASGSFQMSQLFASDGQSIRVSVSASVLSMNIQDWFALGWTGFISLQSKGVSRVFSHTTTQKYKFLVLSFLYSPNLTPIHDY